MDTGYRNRKTRIEYNKIRKFIMYSFEIFYGTPFFKHGKNMTRFILK